MNVRDSIAHFSLTPEGRLLRSDGVRPVWSWDGLESDFVEAGMPQPGAKITVAGSSEGEIRGTIYAYQRFVDKDGLVSNLSPVSVAVTLSASTGNITAATNASPIVITSSSHGLATNDTVSITGVTGNVSANGRWTITVVDGNTFSLNDSTGSGTYESGGTWNQGVGQLDYTDVEAPSDSRVTKRQILRTKDGDASVVYVDVESTNLVATSFSSTNTDDDLANGFALTDTDGDDLLLSRHTVPPNYKPFQSHSNGRAVSSGYPTYNQGAIEVTNGSATVTGHGTNWTNHMAGRLLYVVGASAAYTVSSVDVDNQTLTLTENYGGTSAPYSRYAIMPGLDDRRSFHWSESILPESWNPLSSGTTPEDQIAGEQTAQFSYHKYIYLVCENRMFRLSFDEDPGKDGFVAFGPQRGCVNNKCWVIADDIVYLLDRQGIYAFAGNDLRHISTPVQDLFDPESDSPYKINWSWVRHFHAVHDPEEETVKFFVSMTGRYPRHAICYQLRHQRWWVEEYPVGITASTLGKRGVRRQVYLGAEHRTIFAGGVGDLDGPPESSGTLRGTVTSSTLLTLTDSSASFPASADVVGFPVRIVSGTGKGQWRKVISATSTTLTVKHPWITKPDTTSVYQIGGIDWTYKTGWFRWADTDYETPRAVDVIWKPVTGSSQFEMRIYRDRSDTPDNQAVSRNSEDNDGFETTDGDPNIVIDSTRARGYTRFRMPDSKETDTDGRRFVAVELQGVTNGERHTIFQVTVDSAR